MKYTTEQLEAIAAKLRDMPPVEKKKQEHSKQEAVRIISKEIASLQKRGYTLDQISETLRGEGLSIATPTLKSYLQRAKPVKKIPGASTGRHTPAPPRRQDACGYIEGDLYPETRQRRHLRSKQHGEKHLSDWW